LKECERIYATHDLELESIVHALKKWRHYLMGKIFELRAYHNGLKYLFDQPTLNVRQIKWLEFLREYDFDIKHIKGKENKVVDALSRRVHELNVVTIIMYQTDIKGRNFEDEKVNVQYMELVKKLQQGQMQQKVEDYKLGNDEILLYRNIIYVPNSNELRSTILKEMHNVPYVGHPGYQKIFATVKIQYYWVGMKKEIVEYVAKFLECQKVKVENRHPARLLYPFLILEWKWEVVSMDFITKQHDSIMVVVDKLTKVSYFIPMNITHKETNVVDIYMREVACLHGIPNKIVFDRDPKFASNFWRGLFKGFRTNINFNTAYHPNSNGKTERVNQVIENILRMYVMD
jgi:hypothetical protein